MNRLLRGLSCGFLLAVTGVSGFAQTDELKQIQASRLQRKFVDAKQKIRQVQKSLQSKDDALQVLLELEWLQCDTAQSFEKLAESRLEDYQAIIERADKFLLDYRSNPNVILVEVQQAVTGLRFGELMRKEIQAGISNEQKVKEAFDLLRQADKRFELIDKKLDVVIPGRPRKTVNGRLNQRQLISLQNQVRYQRAKTKVNRGLLYGKDDLDNRVAVLAAARAELSKVIPLIEKVDSTWWTARHDLLICLREIGDFRAAQMLLKSLALNDATPAIQLGFRAEAIRLALDQKDLEAAEALIAVGRAIDNQESADLDFAILEYYLKRGQLSDKVDRKRLQNTLVAIVKAIEDKHGAYWGRRANQALIVAARSTGSSQSATLIRVAQDSYRRKEYKKSIVEFENAAVAAKKELNRNLELELRFQSIVIHRRLGEHQEIVKKADVIAKEFSDTNRAAVVSLLGILSSAELVRQGKIETSDYLKRIKFHMANWPRHSSIGKVAYFLGEYELAKRDYFSAALSFQKSLQAMVNVDGAMDIDAFEKSMKALTDSFRGIAETSPNAKRLAEFRSKFVGKDFFTLVREESGNLESTLIGWSQFALEIDPTQQAAVFEQLQREQVPSGEVLVNLVRVAIKSNQLDRLVDWGKRLNSLEPAEKEKILAGLVRDWESDNSKSGRNRIGRIVVQLQMTPELSKKFWYLIASSNVIVGKPSKATEMLQQVCLEQPRNLKALRLLAQILSNSKDEAELEKGLRQWRLILSRVQPKSEPWFEAKYEIARCHLQLGNQQEAKTMLDVMQAIPPGWSNSTTAAKFDALYRRLSSKN